MPDMSYWEIVYDYLHRAEIELVRILRQPGDDSKAWQIWRGKIKQQLDELRKLREELEEAL